MDDSNSCAVKIAVRERPMLANLENESIISYPATELKSNTLIVDERPFTFDYVLPTAVGQQDLYELLIRPLVSKVKEGFNCTAMAYGQTGTGKSFTMGLNLNNFEGPHVGVIPRCLHEILKSQTNEETSGENGIQRHFFASFIEIYNEKIYDLLAENSLEPVASRDYKSSGGTRVPLTSLEDCYAILSHGTKNRHVRPTKLNSQSSRSHAIFTIHLQSTNQGDQVTNTARLNLVDLAGSEGVRRTGHQGLAMSEGVHINQGLLCIGKVLQAMVNGHKVIPYRDSVLSSVLQDSLSPNSYLTLLACISPCREDLSETLSTLRFAQNAKHLRHAPHINQIVAEMKKNRVKTPHQINPLKIRNVPTPNNRSSTKFNAESKSSINRRTAGYHSNTFSTPNKIKPIDMNKCNRTAMGMTPKEKQRAQLVGIARSTLSKPPSSTYAFDYINNRESLFDRTIESRSSVLSFNISTSTAVDAPVANKPYSYSPVVRQCVAQMETVIENKIQKMFDTLKTFSINSREHPFDEGAGLQTPITPAQQEQSTMQIFPTTIRQELKSIMQELLTSNANSNSQETPKSNIVDESPISESLFATSSPVFKIPEVPKFMLRKGNLNFDSSLESSPNVSREEEQSQESKEPTSICDPTQLSCVAEQTVMNKQPPPPPHQKRRCSIRIAERTTHNESLDSEKSLILSQRTRRKSLKQVHDERRRSVRQSVLKVITETNDLPQQPKSRKKIAKTERKKSPTAMLNNSVIASYMEGGASVTNPSRAISLNKHRKAILDLLNTGTMKELQLLPQVGPKTAYQIVTQRVLNGKFKNVSQVESLPIWRGSSWERFAKANILQ